jgi:predicted acetyltransferase
MNIEVVTAEIEDKPLIATMMKPYIIEMSRYLVSASIEQNDLNYPYFDNYWQDDNRFPFKVLVASVVAGFIFVNDFCHLASDAHSIAEFYIKPEYRRSGVGKKAAFLTFAKFRGNWEVRELASNSPAIHFWRSTIRAFTQNNFTEIILKDARWDGPVQLFHC